MQQMFSPMMLFFVLALATAAVGFAAETQTKTAAATVVVATKNSSARARAMADFVGHGVGDQEEINAAIQSLPEVGGTVLLMDVIEIADETGGNNPIILGQNVLVNSTVDHKKGNLLAPAAHGR
ncbi:MAG: hypothetical protein FJ279_18330 [Planctomycetes bacterium]|nr:hypothetical protein [Planctomycetota bacterium]MBM4085173.1 hypothetical protein [Planctomycetota bacterium]